MPNIASVFKAEIARVARKEAKALTEPLRKSNAQYRRDIAELKRQVREMNKDLSFLGRQEQKRAQARVPASKAKGKRFSPQWLQAHRERLGFSAADYAELVGVSSQTIYNWEQGHSTPREQQLAALAAIRGMGKREALRRLEG
jgi:DNA-binding transcriptional regulator YiaG